MVDLGVDDVDVDGVDVVSEDDDKSHLAEVVDKGVVEIR